MSAIDDTIACIGQLDGAAMAAARERQGTLTKPPGSLGRLEELAVWLAAARPFLLVGHCSAKPGHAVALTHPGLAPLLDVGLRLGEGTGAVLALPILDAAVAAHAAMATFAGAGVFGADIAASQAEHAR